MARTGYSEGTRRTRPARLRHLLLSLWGPRRPATTPTTRRCTASCNKASSARTSLTSLSRSRHRREERRWEARQEGVKAEDSRRQASKRTPQLQELRPSFLPLRHLQQLQLPIISPRPPHPSITPSPHLHTRINKPDHRRTNLLPLLLSSSRDLFLPSLRKRCSRTSSRWTRFKSGSNAYACSWSRSSRDSTRRA